MSAIAKLYSVSRFIRITVCPSIEVGSRLCRKTFTPPASACSAANIRSVSARTKLSRSTFIDTLRSTIETLASPRGRAWASVRECHPDADERPRSGVDGDAEEDQMGAIRVHEFMSLDGVIDAPTWT